MINGAFLRIEQVNSLEPVAGYNIQLPDTAQTEILIDAVGQAGTLGTAEVVSSNRVEDEDHSLDTCVFRSVNKDATGFEDLTINVQYRTDKHYDSQDSISPDSSIIVITDTQRGTELRRIERYGDEASRIITNLENR